MAASKSRGLGKGLEALFNDVEITLGENREDLSENENRVTFININKLKPNSNQPRKHFDEEKIEELAQSIGEHGIIQPVMVRKTDAGYEIVAGERRWRAARKAGLKEIPCIIRELTEEQNILMALIENVQREDLNVIEEAQGIERMIKSFGLTQEEVSKSIGKSRPYITNTLRLLKLPAVIQEMVAGGELTGGHARAIAGIKDEKAQLIAAKKTVESGWSVRDVEEYARNYEKSPAPKRAAAKEKNHEIRIIEDELKETFGTKVNIVNGPRKGKIEIFYFSRDELERLLDMLRQLKQ